MNLASVDESEDGFLAGSMTILPDNHSYMNRSTIGAVEDERHSISSYRGKKGTLKSKYRRDNQTYCGTPANNKCSIF